VTGAGRAYHPRMAQPKLKPATRVKGACATEGCGEPAYACGLCSACYQWDYYWTRKRNPAERREYVKRMERIQHRVESLRGPPRLRAVK
jgi:hypothetical protein